MQAVSRLAFRYQIPMKSCFTIYIVHYMTYMDAFGMQPDSHLAFSSLKPTQWLLQSA